MAIDSQGPTYDQIVSCLAEGQPLKSLFAVADDQWEVFYHRAFLMYKYGRNEEAEPLFRLLCLSDPQQEKYWIALGVVQQQLRKHTEALGSFLEAVRYGSRNPWAALHAAECYLLLKRDDLAMKQLTKASDWVLGSPDAKRILKRMNVLMQSIRNRAGDEAPDDLNSTKASSRDTVRELEIAEIERARLRV